MKDLPHGWITAKLNELTEVNPPKDQISIADDAAVAFVPMASVKEESGGVDVSGSRSFGAVKKGYVQFRDGDVLFAKITPCMENGKIGVVPKLSSPVGYGSTEFHVLRAPAHVEPRWIAHYLSQSQFRRAAQRNMSGSAGQLRVPEAWLSDQGIPVAPHAEQQRIVEKLEELVSDLDAGVAALERARANLKRYRAAVLKAAVQGRLTDRWRAEHPDVEPASKLLERILVERRKKWEAAQVGKYADKGRSPPKGWREKYSQPVKPDVSELPELPAGWCWASLDQLAEIVGGITKGQKRSGGERTRPVPYLRVANVQRGYLDLSEMKSIDATEEEIRELRLMKGDVLFNEGGDRDKLGRGWVWEGQVPECIHQNHVFRARLISSDVLPKFVSIHGNTFGRRWFQQAGKQSVNLASINMGILKRFPVPLPPAMEQAAAIALVEQQVSVLDQSASIVEREGLRSAGLRQAILKRAFEGKLVPQDPKDEPATELLARIRVARVGEGKVNRRARAANSGAV